MYEQEKIKPYERDGHKREQVEEMFNNIAHTYDLLNHYLSFGIDKRWRKKAIDTLRPYQPKHLLDIATGTGDFAILSANRLKPDSIIGADISEGMMEVGRQKVKTAGIDHIIHFQREDCGNLTFEDSTFDAVTVAYGVRNFEDLDKGLSEICRVLKPNGHLLIVELSSPHKFPMKQLFSIYAKIIMPTIGKIISKDNSAYTYLPATMAAFPQGEIMQSILKKAGFSDVIFKRFTFGICTMYLATK